MLSVHGLVIISSSIEQEYKNTFGSRITFWVSSDIGDSKFQRFKVNLWIPNKDIESVKNKIEEGKVCEIVKADIKEIPSKYPDYKFTSIVLECKLENFKFLSVCIYHEDIIGITTKKPGDKQNE